MNGCSNCSKRRDTRKECPWGGTYHHKGEGGEHIGICNAYKQETNADRIRAMSDETLCSFLLGWQISTLEDAQNGILPDREGCKDWLHQPWEEDA